MHRWYLSGALAIFGADRSTLLLSFPTHALTAASHPSPWCLGFQRVAGAGLLWVGGYGANWTIPGPKVAQVITKESKKDLHTSTLLTLFLPPVCGSF